jgi:hypothetical protein
MAADDAADEALVTEMVQAAVFAVTLAARIDEREVAWLAGGVEVGLVGIEIEFFEGDGDAFGESGADEAAGRDSVPVADQAHRIAGGHDFAAVSRS